MPLTRVKWKKKQHVAVGSGPVYSAVSCHREPLMASEARFQESRFGDNGITNNSPKMKLQQAAIGGNRKITQTRSSQVKVIFIFCLYKLCNCWRHL